MDVAHSLLLSFAYAWTATARFHNPLGPCPFCGDLAHDAQGHCVACVVFRRWLQEGGKPPNHPEDAAMQGWLIRVSWEPDPLGIHAATAIDIGLATFDTLCAGSRLRPRVLMDARLKKVCRHHKRARAAFSVG